MDRTLRRYWLIILLIPLKIGEILGNRIDMLFHIPTKILL